MTDIAFSSTVKASELKNTIVASRTHPITSRWSRKLAKLADHCLGLTRDQPLQIPRQRRKQLRLVDDVRQSDQHENEQRHDGQQRVVRHRSGQQQPLVGAKGAQDAEREGAGMLGHVRGAHFEMSHGQMMRALCVAVCSLCHAACGRLTGTGPTRRKGLDFAEQADV